MSLKVKLYSALPAAVRGAATRAYIALRARRERAAAERLAPGPDAPLRVVYITGFPRSGTTMLKYYFAGYPGLRQTAFTPVGFHDAWSRAQRSDEILVDKSNHYIGSLPLLFRGCGRGARAVVVLRDPRDCLVSFARYTENREVPRDRSFWRYWLGQHERLLRYAREGERGDCLFLVRYEDLVGSPEAAKMAFLRWIGIDVDPARIDRRYRNEHPGEGWHDSVHDYREIGTHSLQKWRRAEDLPPWCRQRLSEWADDPEVADLMRRLGYGAEHLTTPSLDPGAATFFQPEATDA